MIVDQLDFQWIYILPSNPKLPSKRKYPSPKTEEEYLEHWGKWVVFGEKEYVGGLARSLDPYVEAKHIYPIKYLRQAPPGLGFEQPVMCVYCDDREKEEVWEILCNLGVTQKQWVYESETIAAWQPGGELFEQMAAYRKLSPEEREKAEKKFQLWNKKWHNHMFEKKKKTTQDQGYWNLEQMLTQEKK